ncbi:MAG: type II toxin-antitoxin system HicB family antitoxin [Gammaproteobacteria bacterium]
MLVKVETYFDGEFWCARGLGEDLFTQGRTLDELHANVREAVAAHFGETPDPIHVVIVSELTVAPAKAPAD